MIYERIKQKCNENKTTVTALESKLEFGKATITKWKKSSPSVDKLQKVAIYFGVPITYFLEDEEVHKAS